MGKRGLVSIIIPCFNNERFIAESINSCLSQTYDEIEIIVVDDGSTDDSKSVIENYGDRVKLIAIENSGACKARNIGLEASEGEWIKFLDGDDFLDHNTIKNQINHADSIDNSKIPFGNNLNTDESGKIIARHTFGKYKGLVKNGFSAGIIVDPCQTASPLILKKMLKKIKGFREELPRYQERDLFFRLVNEGFEFEYGSYDTVMVRQHTSPDRMGASKVFEKEPYYFLNVISDHLESIKRDNQKKTSDIRNALQYQLMLFGRNLIKEGFSKEAHHYFKKAKEIGSLSNSLMGTFYNLTYIAAGPILAERIADMARRFR